MGNDLMPVTKERRFPAHLLLACLSDTVKLPSPPSYGLPSRHFLVLFNGRRSKGTTARQPFAIAMGGCGYYGGPYWGGGWGVRRAYWGHRHWGHGGYWGHRVGHWG